MSDLYSVEVRLFCDGDLVDTRVIQVCSDSQSRDAYHASRDMLSAAHQADPGIFSSRYEIWSLGRRLA